MPKHKFMTPVDNHENHSNAVNIRVSGWARNQITELIRSGVYHTIGQAIDELVKTALSGNLHTQWQVVIPDCQKDLEGYYPILARDMVPGVWGSLGKVERQLCTLVAFYSTLNDVEMAKWANCTPAVVKNFKVSNLGLESVRIGEQRALLSERLRYWRKLMEYAGDPEHPHSKASMQLLGNRLFAPEEKKRILNIMGQDPDGARPIVTNPHDVDMEFMEYAASIQMTPERYVKLYADIMGEPVQGIVQRLVRKYHANPETESELIFEETIEGETVSEVRVPEAQGLGEDSPGLS